MTLPPEFKDIDGRIDSIFKDGESYSETTDIQLPETLPPGMTDSQAEEWMEPIENTGDDSQKYDFDPVEPFGIHEFNGEVNSRLSNNVFIGIDGANFDVKREELLLLKSRGVGFFYPYTAELSRSKVEHPARAFYIMKPGLLRDGYDDYVEVEDEASRAIDLEAVRNKRWMFLRYDRDTNSSNPYMQAMGANVKMMQLSEICAADNASDRAIEEGVEPANVHLLFDGSLPPKSVEPNTYGAEFTRLIEKGINIYSVVKRLSSSRLFVQLLKEKEEICRGLLDIDNDDLQSDYINDTALIRDLLQPGQYTSFIRYKVIGKTRGEHINLPESVIPATSYVMTEKENIFRVEFPSYYLDENGSHPDAHDLVQTFFTLTHENNGGLPTPNKFADKLASYTLAERKSANAIIDSWARNKLGNLKLNKVYGEPQ